ncbi:MAG TPA: Re/Si-specific NAD(P)(+) transhydrogenase subunit alpha [Bacteroidetes bacterium]|nr:Re/Si-specific NAD(P)(+) transhydrogenase subunit alpha [Bacteroidota bacterium]
MKIGVPREVREGETRVAIVPPMVMELKKLDAEVLVEKGAGEGAFFRDEAYENAGARLVDDAAALYQEADIILKVQPPMMHPKLKKHELDLMRDGSTLVGFLSPTTNKELVDRLLAKKMTAFAMELIPRITRAQSMDALSSMATVAGYKAVLISAQYVPKFFPLLMTAAGTIPPANVLVIGAGVAGLQAIATARRLGARVEAFDVRPSVKEQIESLGAKFVEMELPEDVETKDGYAKEVSEDFVRREMEAIGSRLPRMDVVVSTAQVFGKKAPLLITEDMVKTMKEGSVIIDLAAEQGGNCELTEAGKVVNKYGVTIYGPVNLPAALPVDASQMYSRNVTNFVKHLYQAEDRKLDFEDEITKDSCVCSNGELVSEKMKSIYGGNS